jgi:hypothetical protein
MSLDGVKPALFCVKNMSYELDEANAKQYQEMIDFEFIKEITNQNSE